MNAGKQAERKIDGGYGYDEVGWKNICGGFWCPCFIVMDGLVLGGSWFGEHGWMDIWNHISPGSTFNVWVIFCPSIASYRYHSLG